MQGSSVRAHLIRVLGIVGGVVVGLGVRVYDRASWVHAPVIALEGFVLAYALSCGNAGLARRAWKKKWPHGSIVAWLREAARIVVLSFPWNLLTVALSALCTYIVSALFL